MKKIALFLSTFSLLAAGCTTNELNREEALRLIQQKGNYPKVIDYDIYCSDPKYAKKAIDAGLEKEGLVRVQHTQRLVDVGQPLIMFTEKAQPYLLTTPAKDKAVDVQRVKLAEADLLEVTDVKTESDGKKAVVEFTTAYKNITPFSSLTTLNLKEKAIRKARFTLYGDGWQLEQ